MYNKMRFILLVLILSNHIIKTNAQDTIKINICEHFLIKSNNNVDLFLVIKNDTIKGINNANEYVFSTQDISNDIEKIEIIIQQKKYEFSYFIRSNDLKLFLTNCDNIKICIKKQKRNMIFVHTCYNWGITGFLKIKKRQNN